MNNSNSTTFTLHTKDASAWNGSTKYSFNNLNMKEILGEDMYNKYNKFKLVLNVHSGYYDVAVQNRQYYLKLSGLDWINSTDFRKIKVEPIIMLQTATNSALQFNIPMANNGINFSKPTTNINLDITFIDRALNTSTSYIMGDNLFVFSIYGIQEEIPYNLLSNTECCTISFNSVNADINTNNAGSELIFKNVPIREILGAMYYKYDKFKIVLNVVGNLNIDTLLDVDRTIAVKIRGLDFDGYFDFDWQYQTTSSKLYADSPALGIFQSASGNFVTQQFQSNWGVMFNKPTVHATDFTIYLYNIYWANVTTTKNYGQTSYIFSIYGVN